MYIIKDNEGNIDPTLPNYLQESSAIETKSRVLAEWNLNIFENIEAIGNYKNRPTDVAPADTLADYWAFEDESTPVLDRTWYDFTNYDTEVDGGFTDESETPVTFLSSNERQKSLMSLEDCFKKFRPRSGINKLRAREGRGDYLLPVYSGTIFARPRYYPAGKDDNFKYWSSFRVSGNTSLGISKTLSPYLIEDAAPFVVYKNSIPTNKIVMKIQTNTSLKDNGSFIDKNSPLDKDPFFIGSIPNLKSTPLHWKVQKLNSDYLWEDIYSTEEDQFTEDAGWDGYFQLSYGLKNDEVLQTYKENFLLAGTLSSLYGLPNITGEQFAGQAYLIKTSETDIGVLYIHNGGTSETTLENYTDSIVPEYGWYKSEESVTNSQLFVTELDKQTSPSYGTTTKTYREFEYVQGLRIVVNRMINQRTPFDLIELSPRLAVDLTDVTTGFSLKKYASDLGVSSLPVGQLLVSTGSLSIIDYKQVFNSNNKDSLVNVYIGDALQFSFVDKNLQLKFYEVVSRVKQDDDTYKDYYIPLKTMYADGFPEYDDSNRNLNMGLRDFAFYLESQIAPEIFLTNASTSYIIATLLDSIGFSNYEFRRLPGEQDTVIPNFFISPNKTIMQVLQDLAIATQTAMFFDEMNNLVIMSKRYFVPDSTEERDFNIMLYGSDVLVENAESLPNKKVASKKANILNISSQSNDIYTDGKITYYNRYIQKKSNEISREKLLDRNKFLSYEQQVLWSISDIQQTRTQTKNEENESISGQPLAAMALAKGLSDELPKVVDQVIVNNEIDFGDNVYWLPRPSGYFYANGEIIKYDAIQYMAGSQKVWVTSENDYVKYFSEVSFGQKMYPTGIVRIYAEPKYTFDGLFVEDTIAKHGRGQFGTTIASHSATDKELDKAWKSVGTPLVTDSQYLFKNTTSTTFTTSVINNKSKLLNAKMKPPTTTIKNFLGMPRYNAKTKKYEFPKSIQASALSLSGPTFPVKTNNGPSMNYVKKELDKKVAYDTFGARIRLLGTPQEKKEDNTQKLAGSYPLYTSKNLDSQVNGESGGIGILTNANGEGYYYEIVALNYVNSKNPDGSNNFIRQGSIDTDTLIFYRLNLTDDGILKPTILFKTFQNILVDSGKFAAKVKNLQDSVEDSIYDIALKVNKINNKDWRISVYFNGKLLTTVQDKNPVTSKISQSISLFTRGSSQVMFNDVYAIKTMTKKPAAIEVSASSEIFNGNKTSNLSYSKYSLSPLIRTGFLSSLSPSQVPENSIYYEEFGTIMRECAYLDVKFDKVYPALRSKIPPQVASVAQYLVTGYSSTPYRAEFLVFNTSDFTIALGDGQDYDTILNIVGVGYTEEVARELTVDGFYNKRSDFSTNSDYSSQLYKNRYTDIKNSRLSYGNKAFTIESPYIQSEETATELMEYIINKVSVPRKAIGVQVFGMPIIQLGDLVKFSYDTNLILPNTVTDNNFVVYGIEQDVSEAGPSTILYLSEVT